MLDFSVARTFKLLMRTAPFAVLRLLVYIGVALTYVIVMAIGAGIGMMFGKIGGASSAGAGWGGFIGFILVSGVLYWARAYFLYLVKAAHIAVLMELLSDRKIPGGKGQISYGREMVQHSLGSTSLLFGLNELIRGTLKVFHRVTVSIADMLPIPGLDSVVRIFDAIIRTSLNNLDEVILGQIFHHKSDSPWATARDSTVLYAQNYKGILKNSVFLTFIVWGLTVVLFVIVGLPLAALVALAPGLAGFWTFVIAIIIAICLKAAFIDLFAMTALMQVYTKETEGQMPDPAWTQRLEDISDKFKELTQKAREAVSTQTVTQTDAALEAMPQADEGD